MIMRLKFPFGYQAARARFNGLRMVMIVMLLFGFINSIAQVSVPNTVCRDQLFEISGDAAAVGEVAWDFCQGDLLLNPTYTPGSVNGFNIPVGTALIKTNGKWYGFVCSLSSNSLFRLDFGSSLSNSNPAVVELGNIGS